MDEVRVVHYINQFFGGIGGEEKTYSPVIKIEEVVGPGLAIKKELGDRGNVVGTLICGDSFFVENQEAALKEIADAVKEWNATVVIAGPAFNAGRYGVACAEVCKHIQDHLGICAITAMFTENPGVSMHPGQLYIIETGMSAVSMRQAVKPLVDLAVKLSRKEPIGPAAEEGYIPRGYRRNTFSAEPAYKRAVDMLHKKIAGQPYASEVPLERFTLVDPAPAVADLKSARAALVSEDGLVPKGNDQRLTSAMCDHMARYSFAEYDDFNKGEYEVLHGGFDARPVLADRNRQLPLDILRDLIKTGEIKDLYDNFLVTVGNSNSIENCARIGQEMAEKLKDAGVSFAIVPAT